MTLSELASYVCSKIGQTDSDSVAACKTFLRSQYRLLWDAANWPENLLVQPFTVVPGNAVQALPVDFETIIRMFDVTDNAPLDAIDLAQLIDFDVAEFTNATGSALHFVTGPNLAIPCVGNGTPSGPLFGITVSASEPYQFNIRLSGSALNGQGTALESVREELTLSSGSASSVGAYDQLMTAGVYNLQQPLQNPVTLSALVNGVVTARSVIQPGQTDAPLYGSFRLYEIPRQPLTLLVVGKRRRNDLLNDGDAPLVSGADNVLLDLAQADMLERDRQYGKAREKREDGRQKLEALAELKRQQSASQTRMIPADIHGEYLIQGFTDKTHW